MTYNSYFATGGANIFYVSQIVGMIQGFLKIVFPTVHTQIISLKLRITYKLLYELKKCTDGTQLIDCVAYYTRLFCLLR